MYKLFAGKKTITDCRDFNPYNRLIEDLTIDESFKQKYRDNAQLHYPNEIEKFKNRL